MYLLQEKIEQYIYFVPRLLCSIYLGMAYRHILLSSYVISRAQNPPPPCTRARYLPFSPENFTMLV